MANTPANVTVSVTGAVYTGPTTTTAPTNATTALAAGFIDLGYIGTDGLTETRDRSTTQVRAFQNNDLIREVVTESTVTFKFVLLESTAATLAAFYGATLTTSDGGIVVDGNATGGRKSFIFDIIDGANTIRIYVAQGEVLSVGDVVYANGEPIGYDMTVTAYPVAGVPYKKFYSALKV